MEVIVPIPPSMFWTPRPVEIVMSFSVEKGDGSALIEASPLANCTFTIGNAFAISMGQEVSGVYLMNASFGDDKR
jgi:hypothetical protein